MKCNVIGAGRLGKNIALALSASQIVSLQSVCNLSLNSARQSCLAIGSGTALSTLEELSPADVTWITCNDDSIPSVVNALASHSELKPGSFVIHCSGVLNSTVLAPLKTRGCFVASLHPLKAFREGFLATDAFNQVDCVLEGDEQACNWLTNSFTVLGANIITIKPEAKAAYHAAACIASNYLITLASCSEQLFLKAGIPQQQARHMLSKLMQGNLNNIQDRVQLSDSLTGPLMRGDSATLKLHLEAIDEQYINHLYKIMGLATLPLTQLTPEKQQSIERLFK